MNERRPFNIPLDGGDGQNEADRRKRSGLDSYAKGENPTQQTALRLLSLETMIATGLFGKTASEMSEPERVAVDRAKSLMTDTERLRFPQMTRSELSQLSIDLLDRYGNQEA